LKVEAVLNGELFSTFGLVLVAEMGDKTQLAVVTQTCKYRRPWAIFAGASLALTAVTALGAAAGQLLQQWLPGAWLRTAAAVAFVVMGLLIGRQALRAREATAEACDLPEENATARGQDWRAFSTTLALLFLAELGDKTQLAVLSLAGESDSPWFVFCGGALALVVVTALGVIGGQGLSRLLPQRLLLWISAAAFVAMGILMGAGVL